MKTILFSLLLFAVTYSNAQDTSYSRIYEPLIGELDYSHPISDAGLVWDEGLITSGHIDYFSPAFITRIAADGNLVWQKKLSDLEGEGIDFNEVISTRDSSFIAMGRVMDSVSGDLHPFCVKLNALGDTLWTRTFHLTNQSNGDYGTQEDRNGHVIETADSMILIGFHHSSYQQSPSTPDHFCLSKLAMNGDVIWANSYLADGAFYLSGIKQASDGSIYVVGSWRGSQISGYVANLSESGQVNWAREYDGIELNDIELDSNSIYLGWADNSSATGVIKLSLSGEQEKRVHYYSPLTWYPPDVKIGRRSNGNIVSTTVQTSDNQPGRVVQMDENLNYISGYEVSMVMNEVISIPNKGIYAIGYGPLFGVETGDIEMGVVRFDSVLNVLDCALADQFPLTLMDSVQTSAAGFSISDSITSSHLPIQYQDVDFVSESECVAFLGSLDENEGTWNETVSPNPSTGVFNISWGAYRDAEVIIYNSIGTEIYRTSVKNSFVEFDLNSEADGLFYYQLLDQDGTQSSGKLMVLK